MAQNLLLVVVQTEKELLGPMFPLVDSLKLKLILRRLLHYVELKTWWCHLFEGILVTDAFIKMLDIIWAS